MSEERRAHWIRMFRNHMFLTKVGSIESRKLHLKYACRIHWVLERRYNTVLM